MVLSKLADTMKTKDVTLEHLAAKSDLSTATVWKASKGKPVLAKTAKAIARALGVNVKELQ